MTEGFDVDPDYVAAFGDAAGNMSEMLYALGVYAQENACARGGFDGLMSTIKPAVDEYAVDAGSRIKKHTYDLYDTALNLRKAAWMYSGADKDSYLRIRSESEATDPRRGPGFGPNSGATPMGPYGATYPAYYSTPISYPVGMGLVVSLDAPDIEPADLQAKVKEVGGVLYGIDWLSEQAFGFSPVEAITTPISGNWNSLKASGKALENTGDTLEKALNNLSEPLSDLNSHWDGGAAQSFFDYMHRFIEGVGQGAPLDRLVGAAYDLLAAQFEKVAHFIVSTLGTVADKLAKKALTFWIPVYGQAKAIQFLSQAWDIFWSAKDTVDRLQAAVDNAHRIIEMAKNPDSALQKSTQLQGRLGQMADSIGKVKTGVNVAADVAEVSDQSAWESTPEDPYSVTNGGANPRRPGG